jgi:P-type E1-E2 ATPase
MVSTHILCTVVDLKPDVARTEDGQDIPADAVVLDQILVVRSGDKIPVDGELLSPTCDCDESNLTGEVWFIYVGLSMQIYRYDPGKNFSIIITYILSCPVLSKGAQTVTNRFRVLSSESKDQSYLVTDLNDRVTSSTDNF